MAELLGHRIDRNNYLIIIIIIGPQLDLRYADRQYVAYNPAGLVSTSSDAHNVQ